MRVLEVPVQMVTGHHHLVCPSLHPHIAEERLERRGRPENRYIKGME